MCTRGTVVASLQEGWCHYLHLPVFTPHGVPMYAVPRPVSDGRRMWQGCYITPSARLLTVASFLESLFSDHSFWGKPPVLSWKHRHSLSRGPCMEKLGPPASSQQGTEAYKSSLSGKQLLQPPEKLWAKISQLNHRNCNVTKVCCKLLNLGVMCYAARDDRLYFWKENRDICLSEEESAFGLRVH